MSALTVLFFGLSLLFLASNQTISQSTSKIRCNKKEREALIELKTDLIDYNNRLSSWGDDEEDCCNWTGIVCSNSTVTQLRLQNPFSFDYLATDADYEAYEMSMLGGKINRSLRKLNHLVHLDLSGNGFTEIPPFLASITTLRYLNLSNCMFSGLLPPHLGNLTNLQVLDLEANFHLHVENLQWLANLSSLEFLDLSYIHISKSFDWLQVISNALPLLTQLRLSDCNLQYIPSISVNFSSLSVIDLSYNLFNDILIPDWIFSLQSLVFIDLSFNRFEGPIPIGFQNMTSLHHLNLRNNFFNSSLPDWFYSFNSLEYLNLRNNRIQGNISKSMANLTMLSTLILSGNNFLIDGDFFRSIEHLCNLKQIGLSDIKLNQHVADVFRSFSTCISKELEILDLARSQLFGQFKNDDDLESFKNLISLDLSCNSISGRLPTSIGQLSSSKYIDISYNSFHGSVSTFHFDNLSQLQYFYANENQLDFSIHSNWIPPFQLNELRLGFWRLGPRFPRWLRSQENLKLVNMSSSGILDAIPSWFWNFSTQLLYLNLSHNQIYGELPNLSNFPSICVIDLSSNLLSGQLSSVSSIMYGLNLFNNLLSGSLSHFLCHQMNETMEMAVLKLGNNFFSGEVPDCWRKWKELNVLELSNNDFFGSIPSSIGDLRSLQSLQLRNNGFSGILPPSLKGCTELLNLDLAENQFGGELQRWIGESLQNLVILNLRANEFRGSIPEELCQLTSLRILDVSKNNFSGPIPKCVHNFTAMFSTNYSNDLLSHSDSYMEVMEVMLIMMKGNMLEYSSTLNFLRIIDMSSNRLSGNIPPHITKLKQLQSLNLSYNVLTGRVPREIGAMTALESLDLCENELSGEIPQSMSDLNFLSRLNLSNNDLEGVIPSGTQLQSFDASSFKGNKLCGPPLTRSCNKSVETDSRVYDEGNSDGGFEVKWFYNGMAYGFGMGFWIVVGSLMMVRKWRHFYFQLLDRMWLRVRYGFM